MARDINSIGRSEIEKLKFIQDPNGDIAIRNVFAVKADHFENDYLTSAISGSDMTVDGSSTPVIYMVTASEHGMTVGRMMMFMESSTAMSSEKFGDLTALTNGVQIKVNGALIDNWQDNIDLVTTFYDAEGYPTLGKEVRTMAARWTFTNARGNISGIQIDSGSNFSATIRDDLSGLDHFRMKLQGSRD